MPGGGDQESGKRTFRLAAYEETESETFKRKKRACKQKISERENHQLEGEVME